MLISSDDVASIVELGKQRIPREACGILLTRRDSGLRIVEVPNSSPDSDATLMLGADLHAAIEQLVSAEPPYHGDLERDLVIWHTHPGGKVGPGREDMRERRKYPTARCLVVSLPNGEAVQF